MMRFVYSGIVCAGIVLSVIIASNAVGQVPAGIGDAHQKPARPRQPGGLLGDSLGNYLAIEGVLYEGKGKVESNTLIVDTVDGKKLDKPIGILIHNARRLPAKVRCVLKGYELGEMIGSPPALGAVAAELGQKYEERSAAVWRWRPYFVVLIPVEPKGLELVER